MTATDDFGVNGSCQTTVDVLVGPACTVDVPVDVHPRSCPNPFQVIRRGTVPVAILGTLDLDVTQIDTASVQLEGVVAVRSTVDDVGTPFTPFLGKDDCVADCTNASRDGLPDLLLFFDAAQLHAALGSTTDRECRVLHLAGSFLDGTAFEGEDVVKIRSGP